MQYPALPKAAGEAAVRTLLDTVCPGGLLLAVYHDLDDEHREHMKSRGVDPADYFGADDLDRLLGDDFTVERTPSSRASTRRRAPRTSPTSSCGPGVSDSGREQRSARRPTAARLNEAGETTVQPSAGSGVAW